MRVDQALCNNSQPPARRMGHVLVAKPNNFTSASPARCTIAFMNARERIVKRLQAAFDPFHVDVLDESAGHKSGARAETHFRVVLISEDFSGKTLLQRHRAVNACLKEELAGGVHALALNTYTPEEWQAREMQTRESPPCAGSS